MGSARLTFHCPGPRRWCSPPLWGSGGRLPPRPQRGPARARSPGSAPETPRAGSSRAEAWVGSGRRSPPGPARRPLHSPAGGRGGCVKDQVFRVSLVSNGAVSQLGIKFGYPITSGSVHGLRGTWMTVSPGWV